MSCFPQSKFKVVFFILLLFPVLGFAKVALPVAAVSTICPANRGTDLVFPKKSEFKIVSYDKKTKTYAIESVQLPGEGESHITPEALVEGVSKLKNRLFYLREHPEEILEEVYVSASDIPTLFDRELKAREGCMNK